MKLLLNKIQHLCFDKDGVLVDVHAYWRHTSEIRANFLQNKYQLSESQSIYLLEIMGIDISSGKIKKTGPVGYQPRSVIINKIFIALEELEIKINSTEIEDLFLEIDEYQQKNNDFNIKLIDGVQEFLEINSGRFNFTVFTSDRTTNAIITLKKIKIYKYFDCVIGGDQVVNPKPDPEGILTICKKINKSNKNTAYISDTVSDLLMAKKARLPLQIGVSTGLDNQEDLSKNGNMFLKNLNELSNYF